MTDSSGTWRVHVTVYDETFSWVDVEASDEEDAKARVLPYMSKEPWDRERLQPQTWCLIYNGRRKADNGWQYSAEQIPFDFDVFNDVDGWADRHDKCDKCYENGDACRHSYIREVAR